ncbi:Penicillin-binding protein 1F [Frondihabitans sp. 762G35]|uniref:transglycosylase domain-containing protein n=1 Tax=Frondihabitans sp. 762G35 TaxID=1446794 RepID=UPI000D212C97|nr:transglycosylase domain-containing protein [Frondihabitans sp. 762G35]ARC58240.1 Penicillin-binding protein 1F [Frondihabitans sp. 762G35]
MRSPRKTPAVLGFLALSVVSGLLVAAGVTPVVAAVGLGSRAGLQALDEMPEFLEVGKLSQRNVLYANRGGKPVPFATLYDQNRVSLASGRISPTLKDAVVAGEDRRFFDHGGVDATSLVRAGIGSLRKSELGAAGGASTLTMQLVRNILVARAEALDDPKARKLAFAKATDRGPARKIAEMKYALGLEKQFSKDEILAAYLNIAYFGDQAYGVEAAAQHYYGKSAERLSAAEAASLIAIVQYPDERNLGAPSRHAANTARRDVILDSMLSEKKIDAAAHRAAKASRVADYVRLTPATQGCMAVTERGAQQWCDLIRRSVTSLPALGKTAEERARNWRIGGYDIYTTLDLDLTANAKEQVTRFAPNDETRYNLGGVAVSVEAKTGRVIVLTQNKDFDDTRDGGGPTTSAVNYAVDKSLGESGGFQPGSTYKPFTLIDWLSKGHRLTEWVDAKPRNFSPMTVCGRPEYTKFTPQNDNGGNPGHVTTRQATASSINTAFVAMAQQLDLCDIRDVAESLGVHPAEGGELAAYPSSVIGAANTVAPLTMASAFAAIGNDGVYCAPVFIDSVTDSDGVKLPGQERKCSQAIDPAVAALTVSAMQGVFTGGTATSARPGDGVPVFGKTGTTDRAEQTWLVGGTTEVVTASWVGNIDGHQNQYRIYGANGAMNTQRLTIWKNVQTAINSVYGGSAFATPVYTAPEPDPAAPKPKPAPDTDAGGADAGGAPAGPGAAVPPTTGSAREDD